MAKANRKCIVCGEAYHYCNNCNVEEPAYRTIFHDENCKNIFDAVSNLYFKHVTEEEVIARLAECDLSVLKKEGANQNIAHTIESLRVEKKPKKKKKAAEAAEAE